MNPLKKIFRRDIPGPKHTDVQPEEAEVAGINRGKATIQAVVIRADGTKENLGVISEMEVEVTDEQKAELLGQK